MNHEHRKAERHRLHFKTIFDDGRNYWSGHVEDLSQTGLFLESAGSLPVGTVVRLEPMNASEDALFEVKARVVHCIPLDPFSTGQDRPAKGDPLHGAVGIALEFVDLSEKDRRAIGAMISDLEKRAAGIHVANDPYLGVYIPSVPPRPAT
ncbi:MAG: PilZ domain-containing protein [Myxococcota bacterium]